MSNTKRNRKYNISNKSNAKRNTKYNTNKSNTKRNRKYNIYIPTNLNHDWETRIGCVYWAMMVIYIRIIKTFWGLTIDKPNWVQVKAVKILLTFIYLFIYSNTHGSPRFTFSTLVLIKSEDLRKR